MASFKNDIVEILPMLRKFAVSLTGNLSDGDDLLHDAVERAIMRCETFDSGRKLECWMFSIIKNLWIDGIRTKTRRGTTVEYTDRDTNLSIDGREITEQKLMTQKVLKAMSELPTTQNQVTFQVLIEGKSYKETALELNMPIGTVMSNLSRARKALIEKLY